MMHKKEKIYCMFILKFLQNFPALFPNGKFLKSPAVARGRNYENREVTACYISYTI